MKEEEKNPVMAAKLHSHDMKALRCLSNITPPFIMSFHEQYSISRNNHETL